jgi:hypothetical protein
MKFSTRITIFSGRTFMRDKQESLFLLGLGRNPEEIAITA